MDRKWLIWGAFHGFCAVALGAFAAHALKERLDGDMLRVFETGARYEMYGGLALLALALLSGKIQTKAAGFCFAWGTPLFSFSLYALALSGIRGLGAFTPLGGVLTLAGWALLGWEGWKAE